MSGSAQVGHLCRVKTGSVLGLQFGVTVVICGSIMNAHSLQKLSMKL